MTLRRFAHLSFLALLIGYASLALGYVGTRYQVFIFDEAK
jgi:hypothetical protein